ncbi:hypothetical protein [Agrobacterium cavarae]|uniref:hypothetical protein n=1 Tax=Agrobacterium cavarae TaxID=2528239 RepID=UPI0028A5BFF4|nr:hypothetical protein [Agrobacterium cavarae]
MGKPYSIGPNVGPGFLKSGCGNHSLRDGYRALTPKAKQNVGEVPEKKKPAAGGGAAGFELDWQLGGGVSPIHIERRWEEECVVSMINIYSRYPALKSATLAGQQCTNCITAFVMTFF